MSSEQKSGNSSRYRRRPGKPRYNNRRSSRSSRRRRAPKITGFDRVERTYLNLLEQHLQTRKKYFEHFHRANPQQLAKLEKNFYHSLEELRKYEATIKPEFLESFHQKFDGLNLDTTYSQNHNLNARTEPSKLEERSEDPHHLASQEREKHSHDREESTGTLEDYLLYKGLPPDHFDQAESSKDFKKKGKSS